MLGTNISGPLSPTKVALPPCIVPPPACFAGTAGVMIPPCAKPRLGNILFKGDLKVSRTITNAIQEIIPTKMYDKRTLQILH